MPARPHLLPPPLRRLTALWSIGLVLFLCVAVVRPDVHERIHHGHSHDHPCAVQLFAGGVTLSATLVHIPIPLRPIADEVRALGAVAAGTPSWLYPPPCGPPVT